MTKEMLDKGLEIQTEIKTLQHFVDCCESCWKILHIRRNKKIKFRTAYGALADEIIVSSELAERILNTIREYIADKEKELESL